MIHKKIDLQFFCIYEFVIFQSDTAGGEQVSRLPTDESIHGLKCETSEYTPRLFARPHPIPQLTTPTMVAAPLFSKLSSVMRGPPLSPWQESRPPPIHPAHSMSS